jgi:seryl-tRNA synthetase
LTLQTSRYSLVGEEKVMVDELDVLDQRRVELERDKLAQIIAWQEEQKTCLDRVDELRNAIKALGGKVGRKGKTKVATAAQGKRVRPKVSKNRAPDAGRLVEGGGGPPETQGA